jgi:putative intracellular protease/amidase
LLEGKEVTGFSNAEEEIMGLTAAMPFLLEDKIKQEGGRFVKAEEPWGEKVVVDGRLITGQNPASAKGVGEAVVRAVRGG